MRQACAQGRSSKRIWAVLVLLLLTACAPSEDPREQFTEIALPPGLAKVLGT